MSTNHIVVTGGAGFIGSHLCQALLDRGDRVTAIDNLSTGRRANLQFVTDNPRFAFRVGDATEVDEFTGLHAVTHVVHLACPASPRANTAMPIETIRAATIGTLNALDLAASASARAVIASSSEIYGDPQVHPQREDYRGNTDPVGPFCAYTEGKRVSEAAAAVHHRRGTNVGVVRPFNVYGPHMWPEDGRVISSFCAAALRGATLRVSGGGRQTRSFVYGPTFWLKQPGTCWRSPGAGLDAVTDRPNHPVVHIDHADAVAYASWARKRLPTETEWEYAAHGPRWSPWPWGEQWDAARTNSAEFWAGPLRDLDGWRRWWIHRYAVHGTAPSTTVVGRFSPAGDSPFGVTDLSGNVAEWTASTYGPYDPTRSYDPAFAAAMRHRYRVVRGGSWKHFRFQTRTTERIACLPDYSCFDIGFRCAANPDER